MLNPTLNQFSIMKSFIFTSQSRIPHITDGLLDYLQIQYRNKEKNNLQKLVTQAIYLWTTLVFQFYHFVLIVCFFLTTI